MPFVRSIGRWAMSALVINCTIGSGIFGIPSELIRLLGRASPVAIVVAGVAQATITASIVEVASQFSEPGGVYLYVRTAFGRFAGMQVAWFSMLAPIGAAAANANLFVIYFGALLPWFAHGWTRALAITALIAIPAGANCVGVRSGANLSGLLAAAKLLPLAFLIILGLTRFSHQAELIRFPELAAPGLRPWLSASLLLLFAYGGFEGPLIPAGELKDPRRTIPFGLTMGLLVSITVYTMIQFITVATVGASATDHPLADTAVALIGRGGGMFLSFAVMLSTYGNISAATLNTPRLAYSLSAQGDFPPFLGRLHERFNTPAIAIVLYVALVWLLATTGTFLWVLALTAGSIMVLYASTCAALIRLRRLQPRAPALRIPFGPLFAVIGIAISITLLTRLELRQALLMGLTALVATVNWWWAKQRAMKGSR